MKKLKENSTGDTASADMTVFAVMSCSPFTLIPATLITIRQAAGSAEPAEITAAVWIVSFLSSLFAAVLTRLITSARERRG